MVVRTVVVTQDDPFYVPVFFRRFFEELPEEVTVESVVVMDPFDESFRELLARMFRFYGPLGFVRRGVDYVARRVLDATGLGSYSVASVARAAGIDVQYRETVNDDAFRSSLKDNEVDVVLSVAAPEIFDPELLSTPEWCLNVHTADLPKYRGMMPTFWALYHGEDEIGVTVHTMVEEIDQGEVVAKDFFDVSDTDSLDTVIRRGKRTGGSLAATVLGQVAAGDVETTPMEGEGSYFSFPSREKRRELQERGYRLL